MWLSIKAMSWAADRGEGPFHDPMLPRLRHGPDRPGTLPFRPTAGETASFGRNAYLKLFQTVVDPPRRQLLLNCVLRKPVVKRSEVDLVQCLILIEA